MKPIVSASLDLSEEIGNYMYSNIEPVALFITFRSSFDETGSALYVPDKIYITQGFP